MTQTTTPPGHPVVLFDGHCVFCRRSKDQLDRVLRDDAVEYTSFRDDGALERFPGVTEDQCDLALQLITSDGRGFQGAEAAARALVRRPWFFFAWLYYVPGIKQIADFVYRFIARRRFGIAGRSSECSDDVCSIHDRNESSTS